MAYRDRSQGAGFIYVDIAKLLRENKKKSPTIPTHGSNVINMNRDSKPIDKNRPSPLKAKSVQDLAQPSKPKEKTTERHAAIQQIKKNLDRLQSLHHKLHTMLEEINSTTKNKKKD